MSQDPTDPTSKPGDMAPASAEDAGETLCPDCGGSGQREGGSCPTCEGTGTVIEPVGGG